MAGFDRFWLREGAMSNAGSVLLAGSMPLTTAAMLLMGSPAGAQDQTQAAMDKPLATFDEHGFNVRTADDSVNFISVAACTWILRTAAVRR